jgi:O-antigen/teichoic acid export membrane protein
MSKNLARQADEPAKARRLHTRRAVRWMSTISNASASRLSGLITGKENPFHDAKLREAWLVAYKAFADLSGKGSLFVITVVAARVLTPEAFGLFGLGTTLGWLVAVLGDFGMQLHVARAIARAPEAAPALLRQWRVVRLATTIGAALVVLLGLMFTGIGRLFAVPLLTFAAAYSCASLVEFLNYVYRGLSRSDVESTLTIVHRAATLGLALAVLIFWPTVTLLAVAMLVPSLGALVWSWRAATAIAVQARAASSDWPVTPRVVDTFARDVLPVGLGIVLSALYFRIDVLLVQLWAGIEAVASYNAVYRIIDALRLFPAAVLAVVLPRLCRAADLAPLARVATFVTAFGCVIAAGLWIVADRLVPMLFGSRYADGVPSFRILALSFPLLSLNLALTHQLVGWNRQRAYAAICAIALVVNVALNAWLIPAWSIEGAAWATLGTEICLTAGCAVVLLGNF